MSAEIFLNQSEFDAFLFAPIGEERNGMLLSVLSALARLDIDPWREAAELARMPIESANLRLTSLIASLPDRASAWPESGMIAARLIALLPLGRSSAASGEIFPAAAAMPNSRAFIYVVLINLLIMAGIAGAHWAVRSTKPLAIGNDSVTSAASQVFPKSPSQNLSE